MKNIICKIIILLLAVGTLVQQITPTVFSSSYNDEQYIVERGEYIVVEGMDEGFEVGMDQQSNAVVRIGADENLVFVLAYDWNKNRENRNGGFQKTGLYTADLKEIYTIPSLETEGFAEISSDGQNVWLCSEYYFDSPKFIPINFPVIQKYTNGQLSYKVPLYKIIYFPFCLHSNSWCIHQYHQSANNHSYLVFKRKLDKMIVYVDRNSGKIRIPFSENRKNVMYWLELFTIPFLIVVFIICILKRKKKTY